MDILNENLLALGQSHPQLAEELMPRALSGEMPKDFRVNASRAGDPTLSYRCGERWIWLHSPLDPQREAERQIAHTEIAPFYILIGLGMGYLAERLLARDLQCEIVVCEPDPDALLALLHARSLKRLLATNRCIIGIARDSQESATLIHSCYIAEYHGVALVIPLRAMLEHNSNWRRCHAEVQHILHEGRANNAIHSNFGRLWARNLLLNRRDVLAQPRASMSAQRAVILAAGPTLDIALAFAQGEELSQQDQRLIANSAYGNQLRKICNSFLRQVLQKSRHQRQSLLVIAVDSALPALLARGIIPDLAVSIDSQLVTYHHFLPLDSQLPQVIADSALSPTLVRYLSKKLQFGGGEHPLASQLQLVGETLAPLETAAGNVTHSAVRIAIELGCRTIDLFGADYGYLLGKPYGRGSYLLSHFERNATRLQSFEQQGLDYCLRWRAYHGTLVKGDGNWIAPPHFRRFREGLLALAATHGVYLQLHGAPLAALYNDSPQSTLHHKRATVSLPLSRAIDAREALTRYQKNLSDLPALRAPFGNSLRQLEWHQRGALVSLLPLMRHIAAYPWRYGEHRQLQEAQLQHVAQELTLRFIQQLIPTQ